MKYASSMKMKGGKKGSSKAMKKSRSKTGSGKSCCARPM